MNERNPPTQLFKTKSEILFITNALFGMSIELSKWDSSLDQPWCVIRLLLKTATPRNRESIKALLYFIQAKVAQNGTH